jgi:hypothetical protein
MRVSAVSSTTSTGWPHPDLIASDVAAGVEGAVARSND